MARSNKQTRATFLITLILMMLVLSAGMLCGCVETNKDVPVMKTDKQQAEDTDAGDLSIDVEPICNLVPIGKTEFKTSDKTCEYIVYFVDTNTRIIYMEHQVDRSTQYSATGMTVVYDEYGNPKKLDTYTLSKVLSNIQVDNDGDVSDAEPMDAPEPKE